MATDIDKLKQMANDTITHKKIVLDNCLLMAIYFIEKGKYEMATQILIRGSEHDNSKFDKDEFRKMSMLLKAESCRSFTNASTQLSPEEQKAIKYHWSHNRHHPEYFENPSEEMTDIDLIEMVCDWFARSLQFNTEFIPFILERQENRFHFSEKCFAKILKYCKILEELYNKEHNSNEKQ